MTERHGERRDTPVDEPAPTVTSKWRSDEWILLDRRQTGAPPLDPRLVPSPTLTAAAVGKGVWVVRSGSRVNGEEGEWVLRVGAQVNATVRTMDAPAPTILASADNGDTRWVFERPATTIVGSFGPDVVAAPGYRTAGGSSRQNAEGSIKITEQDALVIQSFRPDYPVQGSRSKRFEQIGNAVPPLLAAHLLKAIMGRG